MGISFSCAGCEYDEIFNEYIETFFMRSISFKAGDVETTFRPLSFKGQEAPTMLKSFESGKMIIEESVSFKGRNPNPFDLGTIGSYKAPPLAKECARVTKFKESEISSPCGRCNNPMGRIQCLPDLAPCSPTHEAAVKLQKVYKSFRTRRQLADCAVLVEQHWWKLLDFATLKRSSVSFFDIEKPETAVSRWSRARTRAAKVGKGLSKNVKARKLALQHWLEAIDPRHRYGHNLHFYYDTWLNCDSRQPFFYWLDVGEGRDCNIERCSRSKLQQQCIKYLGPKEREAYEVIVENGKFLHKQTLELLDTSEGSEDAKWIFVLSTSKALYVGQKLKGTFQHSSFLAGGATSAAGGLEVEKGVLKAVWRHSGHYRPTAENFRDFFSFLSENNVDLSDVKNGSIDGEEVSLSREESSHNGLLRESTELDLTAKVQELAIDQASNEVDPLLKLTIAIPRKTDLYEKLETEAQMKAAPGSTNVSAETFPVPDEVEEEPSTPEEYMTPKWNLFEEDHEEDEKNVPEESILRRINSREGMKSYQLGKQLSFKWTTGAGPRIACVRDYPMEIQYRALEKMSLSPRSIGNSRALPLKTRRLDSQELTLTCPSPLSTSEANITSFCNNY